MSLSTNMQTLIEEKSLLQAQLEVQEQNSAARIRELEQKVNTLEVHKRMSARKPDDQAVQPAMPTSSSDPDLRAEIAQLRGQGSELLGMVRKYDEVFDKVEKGFTASAAALRSTKKEEFDKLSKSVVEAIHNRDSHPSQEHQPQKESKASLSVANTENSKPSSTPPTKGFGAEVPFRPNPVPPATPFKFQDNSPTAPSQPTCAGALQKPREEAQRKPRVNPNVAKQPSTHSEFTAKKEAEQQRQGRSDKPNKSHGLGGAIRGEPKDRGSTHGEARGRGSTTRRGRTPKAPTSGELSPHTGSTVNDPCKDARPADCSRYAGPKSTQVTVPAKLEKSGELEVANATEGRNQPSQKPQVGLALATSSTDKKASSQLRAEATAFVPNPLPAAVSDRRRAITAKEFAACERFGFPRGMTRDDYRIGTPPLPMTLESTSEAVESGPQSPHDGSASTVYSPKPSAPPAQRLETRDLRFNRAAPASPKPFPVHQILPEQIISIRRGASETQMSEETSSSGRKRSANEELPGVSASLKRLRK